MKKDEQRLISILQLGFRIIVILSKIFDTKFPFHISLILDDYFDVESGTKLHQIHKSYSIMFNNVYFDFYLNKLKRKKNKSTAKKLLNNNFSNIIYTVEDYAYA